MSEAGYILDEAPPVVKLTSAGITWVCRSDFEAKLAMAPFAMQAMEGNEIDGRALVEATLPLVMDWDGVRDRNGNVVDFTQQAAQKIDLWALVDVGRQLLLRLTGNPTRASGSSETSSNEATDGVEETPSPEEQPTETSQEPNSP